MEIDNFVTVLANMDPLSEVASHRIYTFILPGGTEVVFSNHMLMITFTAILLMIVLPLAVYRKKLVRHGFGNFIETICIFIREDIAKPYLHEYADKYTGFLWTIFFFIVSLNLMGMMPFEKLFILLSAGKLHHVGGAPTANIWVTGSLALIAFFMIHFSGIRAQGLAEYLKNFTPPVPIVIKPLLFIIEVISSLVKPFALAVRLFANILAGHILLSTVMGFIFVFKNYFVAGGSIVFAVLMSLMELFVACLQAYIFTFLTAIFISFSVSPQH